MADYIESFKEHLINCGTHFEGDQIEAAGDVLNESPIITKARAYDQMKPVYEELVKALKALQFQFAAAIEHPYSKDKEVYNQVEQVLTKAAQLEKEK